jgi:predicted metal-dependent peptidase
MQIPPAREPMDAAMEARLTTKLAKAKTALILTYPFFGTLAMKMPFSLSEEIPTAATNGKWVKFNPHFLDDLSDEEATFVVAHEIMHPALEHNYRRLERNPKKWNQAGDYVINQVLNDDNVGKMPEGCLFDTNLYNAGGQSTDGIYNLLPEPPDEGEGGEGGGDGNPLDGDCQDGDGSPQEREQQAREWRVNVAQAAQSAKMMGKLSAGVERLVDEILNPKVDWRTVLQQFVVRIKDENRSYARPNRRFIDWNIIMPSRDGEALGPLLFGVDCSGSVGQKETDQYAAEIIVVQQDHNPEVIHIVYFDSEVSHYDKFQRGEEVVIKPHGGGGTAFSPIFEYAQEHGIEPVACVVLTDLCCNDFGDAPDYPVLWVSTRSSKAPWGQVVMV